MPSKQNAVGDTEWDQTRCECASAGKAEKLRWTGLLALLIVVSGVTWLASVQFMQLLVPWSQNESRVGVLPCQQQLVKLPKSVIEQAAFNASIPSNSAFSVTVFDRFPALSALHRNTLTSSHFAHVSLARNLSNANMSDLHTAFVYHLLEGGNMQLDVVLPSHLPNVSLRVFAIPELTTATQNIYDWPSNTDEFMPVSVENMFLKYGAKASLQIDAKITGHYLVSFIQTVSNQTWSVSSTLNHSDAGSIQIQSSTPMYNTSASTSNCENQTECVLVPKNSNPATVHYALFESSCAAASIPNFLNASEIMQTFADQSLFMVGDLHTLLLKSSGFHVASYNVVVRRDLYLPLFLVIFFMWTASLFTLSTRMYEAVVKGGMHRYTRAGVV